MKTNYNLQLSAAAVRACCIRPQKGQGQALPLRIARWIFLQFCIFAFLPIFAQTPAPDFTDSRDGETYKTVLMPDGKRWMAENLRYRKDLDNPVLGYRPVTENIAAPGTNLQKTYYCPGPGPFPTSPNISTASQADPLRCEYEGSLYPFWTAYGQNNGTSAVTTTNAGEQGVCPSGWHLPSDGEWTKLATILSNNFSSLQVLNAGRRDYTGIYADRGLKAYFWTSSGSGTAAVSRSFSGGFITRNASQPASDALSVRCVEGSCIENFSISFSAVPDNSCENIPVWNEIGILTGPKTRTYNLSIPASVGNWTYAVSMTNYTTSGAPTVSISGNGTASASVTFTINNPVVGKTFTILITAINPICCGQLSETHTFTLKEVPVPNTIVGNEGVGAIKTMTDVRDCKVYSIIKMGDGKWWMRENLNYQKGLTFRSVPNVPFASTTNGIPGIGNFWCPGNHTTTTTTLSHCVTWGALYTWEAAVSTDGIGVWSEPAASQMYTGVGSGNPASVLGRGVCPPGWHIPSDREWGNMLNVVETGTKNHNTAGAGWIGTNAGTILKDPNFTNGIREATGFSVLATGSRNYEGTSFYGKGLYSYFWSASGYSSMYAWFRQFSSSSAGVFRSGNGSRSCGIPVRCLQD